MALSAAASIPAYAEHQALIVGVGDYAHDSVSNLPGIDLDVDMMRDAAQLLGFRADNIRTLLDQQATLTSFRHEVQRLAANTYADDDRVLIYFSGHGTHVPDDNGDEPDEQDEALVLHDTRVQNNELRDFLRDDEFGKLLNAIPSGNVLVLIDACHSGTATKSFRSIGERGTPKYFRNLGTAYRGGNVRAHSLVPEPRASHVLLSEAADNELAQATGQGSAFTLGVSEAVKAARNAGELTPAQLKEEAARHIAGTLSDRPDDVHHPQLDGRPAMLAKNLFFRPQSAIGPTLRKAEELAASLANMDFTAPKTELRVGEKLVLSLELPHDGYLNVLNVNPNDEAVVLFPNAHHRDNRV